MAIASGANVAELAASPLLTVMQHPEYPMPGKEFSYPPGLLAEICSDGRIYRALGAANVGKSAVEGTLSDSTLQSLRGALVGTWFYAMRGKCTSDPVPFHVAAVRIGLAQDTFECSVFQGSGATELLDRLVWALQIVAPEVVAPRQPSGCK